MAIGGPNIIVWKCWILGGNDGDRELPILAHAFRRLLLWLSNPLFHFMSREDFLIRSIHLAATDYPTRNHFDEASSCDGSQVAKQARMSPYYSDCDARVFASTLFCKFKNTHRPTGVFQIACFLNQGGH